jgi:hypothetical protein
MMKRIAVSILIFSSIFSFGQGVSVEPFPENINDKSAYHISYPSMNETETRLCFKKKLNMETDGIMISEKGVDGKWADPYPVIQFTANNVVGCAITADGNQIYFGLDNDIYRIEYVDGKWSERQLVGKPVSQETLDAWPSMSRDNQTLSFLRTIRTPGMSDWMAMPFMCQRKDNNQWSDPQMIIIKELGTTDEVNSFYYDSKSKCAIFASGSSQQRWGNYYGVVDNGVCRNVKKIDFKGGYITWVNKSYTRGLIITATNPSRIAMVKFSTPLIDPASVARDK